MKRLNKLGFVSDFDLLYVMLFSAFLFSFMPAKLFLTFHFDNLHSSDSHILVLITNGPGVAPPIIIDRYFVMHYSEQCKEGRKEGMKRFKFHQDTGGDSYMQMKLIRICQN